MKDGACSSQIGPLAMSNMMTAEQIQARFKFLRENPQIPALFALGSGLVGVLLLALTRRPKRDSVSDAITRGDFDAMVREAARQGYEAGYGAAATEYSQKAQAPRGISILGMSPAETVSLVGLMISVVRQAVEFVREQSDNSSQN
jgi:hypothetical protein